VAFGQSFGVASTRADDLDTLRSALAEGFAHPGPSLIVSSMGDVANPWPYLRMPPIRG
jgi:thiamine pyrophosphate-dependent acetolactate synthase large subunit-like protein